MNVGGLKIDPVRLIALVPVVLIAGAVIAFLLGHRPEGRRIVVEWRTHAVAEHNFAVTAPGLFVVGQQTIDFADTETTAQTYHCTDRNMDFIVSVVRRPNGDERPPEEVAESQGLSRTSKVQRADGLSAFRHDAKADDGSRTQALLIFHGRTMYQVMVVSPARIYRTVDAEKFLSSFRLLKQT